MKNLKSILILVALMVGSVHAKSICVATCVIQDIHSENIKSAEALIQISASAKSAQTALEKKCPNVLEGSVSEGGTNQSLGKLSCSTI